MTSENEGLQNTENSMKAAENAATESPKDTSAEQSGSAGAAESSSWLGEVAATVAHKIEEALGKIDADFPLSGGETEDDLEKVEQAD